VSLRLDGELSPFEDAELLWHLSGCESCRAYDARVAGFTQMLETAPLEPLEVPIVLPRRRRLSLGQAQVAVAAAVVGVIGLGSMVGGGIFPVSLQNSGSSRSGQHSVRPAYLDSSDYEQRLLKQIRNKGRFHSGGAVPL
jgi:predicted anti-sigma-YlaC factor YlaD